MPHVLVIEDDVAIRTSLVRSLKDRGHAVSSAPSGMTGLQLVLDTEPDVVLLDLGLPDASGTQGVVRMTREAASVPVVVLTGNDNEALGLRAVQDGAQDYLVKGQTVGALLQRSLRFAIERKRAEQALARLAVVMGSLCFECGRKVSDDPATRRFQH